MEKGSMNFLVQQLAYQIPVLTASLVGMVLSLVFIKRYRLPSLLTLTGTLVLIVSTLVSLIAQSYYVSTQAWMEMPTRTVQVLTIIGWVGSIFRGLAIALLLAAIFISRKRPGSL